MSEPSFREYCCQYYHDGSWWCLNIQARDEADAEARVAKLGKLGKLQLLGELQLVVPAKSPAWFVRLLTWLANWKRGFSE